MIFLPLFFASRITDTTLLFNAVIAFLAFSLIASAIYILNDYLDMENDKQHPVKKNRPLASGVITKPQAVTLMLLLVTAGFGLIASLSVSTLIIVLTYVTMNVAYSFYLKHVAILDVAIIAIGFVLRLMVGSTVTEIPLSIWIVIMTFLLALFLALAKRRDDVLIYLDTGKKMRQIVDGYNLQFLDTAMAIMASVVIVAYIMYATSTEVTSRLHSEHLYLTTVFVVVGILRYLQIALVEKGSGSPTQIVLRDRYMQMTLIGWFATFAWLLY